MDPFIGKAFCGSDNVVRFVSGFRDGEYVLWYKSQNGDAFFPAGSLPTDKLGVLGTPVDKSFFPMLIQFRGSWMTVSDIASFPS